MWRKQTTVFFIYLFFRDLKAFQKDQEPLYAKISRWIVLFKNNRDHSIEEYTKLGRW